MTDGVAVRWEDLFWPVAR